MPQIYSNILLTSDRKKISYRHYDYNHNKALLIAHGFYNSKDAVLLRDLAEGLIDAYDVFMFDFRGHGKSSGLFTWLTNEEEDLKAVFGYLKGKYAKIGIIAFSLGASAAINTLKHNAAVDSLVCVSAVSDFNKIDCQFWKLDWKGDFLYTLISPEGRKGKGVRPGAFWLKKHKPIESVGGVKIPILYIHGQKDWVVKPWHSQALYDNTHSIKKIVVIKNGPHAEYLMRDSREEFLGEIRDWFVSTM